MSKRINLEGTIYEYTLKPLTGHDVIEHQKRLAALDEFTDVVICRVTDLVEEVRTDDGRVIEDVMSLDWQDVLISLAIAAMRGLLPKAETGTSTDKTEV